MTIIVILVIEVRDKIQLMQFNFQTFSCLCNFHLKKICTLLLNISNISGVDLQLSILVVFKLKLISDGCGSRLEVNDTGSLLSFAMVLFCFLDCYI